MTLTPEIITMLLLDGIFLVFGCIAFMLSFTIIFHWDINATTPYQYTLEKRSYLVGVIVKYIFYLKLPLFLFFIFTTDKLSVIITGAMCASGVINSVSFGLYLTLFKVLNLYLFGFWLLLSAFDRGNEKLPFTKQKFIFFTVLFVPFLAEIILEILFFTSLDISKIVSCCGTLFSIASTSSLSLLFKVDSLIFVGLFYFFAMLMGIGYKMHHRQLFVFSNFMFLLFAIISLIVFFSSYIYELPTHHCPFCIVQKEYYGIGYLLYITLFTGTFFGLTGVKRFFKISIIFNLIYSVSISLYPFLYYVRNGVWL